MIINFGYACMSLGIRNDKPIDSRTVHADITSDIGGSALIQAVAASRSGARTCLIGTIGNDLFSKHILTILRRDGIQTSNIVQTDCPTQTIVKLKTPHGMQTIVNKETETNLTDHRLPDHIFNTRSILSLCNDIPAQPYKDIITHAFENDTTILLSLTNIHNLCRDAISKADIIIIHPHVISVLQDTLGADCAKSLSTQYQAHVIYLHDINFRRISVHTKDNNHYELKSDHDNTIDHDACFDVFCGNIAACFQAKFAIKDAITHARAAAILCGQKEGCYSSLPYLDEILSTYKQSNTEFSTSEF